MLAAAEAVAAAPAEPGVGTPARGSGRRGGIGLAIVLALVLPTAATVLYLEPGRAAAAAISRWPNAARRR